MGGKQSASHHELTLEKKAELSNIQYGDWMSEEYSRLVANVYREQAAMAIQAFMRAWRKRHGKSVSKVKSESVAADRSRRLLVIREPSDNKYKAHVEKIKQGKYLELNYQDPEFVRNIFKALRLNEISLNQMLMAHSIYQAKEWLHDYNYPGDQLHEFEFSDKLAPYQPSNIPYATESQLKVFCQQLGDEDKKYVTINFPKNEEMLFFCNGIDWILSNSLFKTLFIKSVLKSQLSNADKDVIKNIIEKEEDSPAERKRLKSFYKKITKDLGAPDEKTKDTINFLIALLRVGECNPSLVLSPNHDDNNPDTPTIAFVIMTLEAEKQLQLAIHGKEGTLLVPTAGLVSTRMIRAFDEGPGSIDKKEKAKLSPEKSLIRRKLSDIEISKIRAASVLEVLEASYGVQYEACKQQARPVEITHPDLTKNSEPHGYCSYDFILTWHDRFHAWRSGANFKNMIRHERNLLSRKGICQEKDFVMSKPIWYLTDIDCSYGRILRSEKDKYICETIGGFIFYLLDKVGISKSYDLLLLQLIDFIRFKDIWHGFIIDVYPNKIFPTFEGFLRSSVYRGEPGSSHWKEEMPHQIVAALEDSKLKEIIAQGVANDKPNESIILRCKLRMIENAETLCSTIDEIGIQHFFYWQANSGLFIRKEFHELVSRCCYIKNFSLDTISADLLTIALLLCVKKLNEEKFTNLVKKYITNSLLASYFREEKYKLITEFVPYIDKKYDLISVQRQSEKDYFISELQEKHKGLDVNHLCHYTLQQLKEFASKLERAKLDSNKIKSLNQLLKKNDQNLFSVDEIFILITKVDYLAIECSTSQNPFDVFADMNKLYSQSSPFNDSVFKEFLDDIYLAVNKLGSVHFLSLLLELFINKLVKKYDINCAALRGIKSFLESFLGDIRLNQSWLREVLCQLINHKNYKERGIHESWRSVTWSGLPKVDQEKSTKNDIIAYALRLLEGNLETGNFIKFTKSIPKEKMLIEDIVKLVCIELIKNNNPKFKNHIQVCLSQCKDRKKYGEIVVLLTKEPEVGIHHLKIVSDIISQPLHILREENDRWFGFGLFGKYGNTDTYQNVISAIQDAVLRILKNKNAGELSADDVSAAQEMLSINTARMPWTTIFMLDKVCREALLKHLTDKNALSNT